jgi:hypothetical protein
MLVWVYATRIPAMRRAGAIDDRVGKRPGHLDEVLPAKTQWKAHNYNHLMEQPTLFYAVILMLAIMGDRDQTTLGFAWAYVALRIIHSIVQSTVNIVRYRTILFALASGCLFLLTIRLAAIVIRTSA